MPALLALALGSGPVHAEPKTQIRTTGEGVTTELGFWGPSACERSHLLVKSGVESGEWNGNTVATGTTTMLLSSWNFCTQRYSQAEAGTSVQDLQVDPGLGGATLSATVDIPNADGSAFLHVSVDLAFDATDPVVRERSQYVDHSDGYSYHYLKTDSSRQAVVSGTLIVDGAAFPAQSDAEEGSGAVIRGTTYRVLEITR
jgi:hypothetical protein